MLPIPLSQSEKTIKLEKRKKELIIRRLNEAARLLGQEDYQNYHFAKKVIEFLTKDILT